MGHLHEDVFDKVAWELMSI